MNQKSWHQSLDHWSNVVYDRVLFKYFDVQIKSPEYDSLLNNALFTAAELQCDDCSTAMVLIVTTALSHWDWRTVASVGGSVQSCVHNTLTPPVFMWIWSALLHCNTVWPGVDCHQMLPMFPLAPDDGGWAALTSVSSIEYWPRFWDYKQLWLIHSHMNTEPHQRWHFTNYI